MSSVVLPAPFGPSSAEDLALADREVDSAQRVDALGAAERMEQNLPHRALLEEGLVEPDRLDRVTQRAPSERRTARRADYRRAASAAS